MNIVGVIPVQQSVGAIVVVVVYVRLCFQFDFPELVVQILEGSVSIYGRCRGTECICEL